MALNIPKQQVTGVLRDPTVAGIVNIPKLQISATLVRPFLNATVSIPMPVITGGMSAQAPTTIAGAVQVPMQQVTAAVGAAAPATVSAAIQIPMQAVTAAAGVAAPLTVSGSVAVPMQLISASAGSLTVGADVGIPMQQVAGTVSATSIDGAIGVPMQRLYGLLPEISAVVAMPMQQVAIDSWNPILSVPMQQVAGEVAVPLEVTATIPIPMVTFPVYVFGDMAASGPQAASAIHASTSFVMAGELPLITGAAEVVSGNVAQMAGAVPMPTSTMASDRPASLAGAPDALAHSGIDAVTGIVAAAAGAMAAVASSLDVTVWAVASIAGSPAAATSSIGVDSVAVGELEGQLSVTRSAIAATVGVAASIGAAAPSGAVSALQIWVQPGVSIDAWAPQATSQIAARALAQAVKVYAMNLKAGAVSEVSSALAVESVASLEGVVYVAGANGVYAMSGPTDGGAAFTKSALLAMLDFGAGQKKHPESCLIEASASTPPVLTVRHAGGTHAYTSVGPKRGTLYRAKVGRGITGKRLQFEVSGAGLNSIESVDALVESGKRSF